MNEYLKIKVSIADRVYPLTIKREEEEGIRLAAQRINDVLKDFESSYAVRDKQDLLAMATLQFAVKYDSARNELGSEDNTLTDKLKSLEEKIERVITQ